MKRCYFCRGEVVAKKIRHIHQWGDKIILFEDIPAEVCKQCGEAYFAPAIVEAMDKGTMQAEKAKESIKVPVISYHELVKTQQEGLFIRPEKEEKQLIVL